MGQQQLFIVILGTLVIGVAIAVRIVVYQDNAISSNCDALHNDLIELANLA